MISLFLTVFPSDWYLAAGRIPAVLAGAISVFMTYKLSELLFEKKEIAVIASVLYIVFPFTFLYDRMALFDPLLQATLLAATYFSIKTAKNFSYKYAVLWGISLGLAYLSKPIALVFLVLLPFGFLLFNIHRLKKSWKHIGVLILIPTVIAELINNAQRVSSVYFMAGIKNSQFQQPIEELLKNPFALTVSNMHGFYNWVSGYYTIPFLLLGVIGIIILIVKNYKAGLLLAGLWIIPILGLATLGREIFPRYILFTTPYFLIITAWMFFLLYKLVGRYTYLVVVLVAALLLPFIKTDFYLLTKPEKAQIPKTDYDQFVGTHPSGYGVDRVYAFINDVKANGEDITVVTQGTFGLYPYAFNLEYWDDKQVSVVPRWPLDKLDDDIFKAADNSRVLVILKEYDSIPDNLPLVLIEKIQKPSGEYPILLTEINYEALP
jgi:4-amino-4-deoxy-L-arabinose transferase-like glycosyltransferase